jgi:hypothetical protein
MVALFVSPFFVGYALWRIGAGLFNLFGRGFAAKRLLAESLPCPSCGADNRLDGRWTCSNCKAEYHGFVGECSFCRAGCSVFPCERCGISIPVGL